MKMGVSNTYINTIVDSLGKKKNNYIFVKHYGKYSIDAEDAKNVMDVSENLEVSYVHFESNEISDSYQPFLSIIKNCYEKYYSELSVDEYLEMFDIYQLHESFFKAYVSKGESERYEPFILDEIEFEKKMMLESVANIILTLSKQHPMIIMIDNVHVLSSSSIRLLKYMFDHTENTNIGVFATYNDLKNVANINKKEWDSFINTINVKGCVFEGGADGNDC